MAFSQFMQHLWSGFKHYATIAFRALGLNIVVCWLRSFFSEKINRKQHIEFPKVAIRRHRPSAFLRALVHVLPVTAALFLVIINLYQYYVGSSIQSLVFYQFIAKVFEIMAQASLAAIVFSYVRHEMILGQAQIKSSFPKIVRLSVNPRMLRTVRQTNGSRSKIFSGSSATAYHSGLLNSSDHQPLTRCK
ncbi:MAG: hypothetical protein Q9202_000377 [Teloschistes flavicans]